MGEVRTFDELLSQLRSGRGFDADEVIAAKIGRLSRWFSDQDLDGAVVGVSGGIDSATVVGLLSRLREQPGSPLRRLVAVIVPIVGTGSTRQELSCALAGRVAEQFEVETWVCAFSDAHAAAVAALEAGSGQPLDGWTSGQLLSVMRTPALYGAAAQLQAQGSRSVVVGTTNRDEGAYLGFFGKASDAMVDLQPISDLHKTEVRAVARALGVPAEVIAAEPCGDVWDGRNDAEMIGADYDEVEVLLRLRELGLDPAEVADGLSDGDRVRLADDAVERLHEANAHKYRVGSPAVHLDVLPRGVPGGWSDEALSPRTEQRPDRGTLPGEWSPPSIDLEPMTTVPVLTHHVPWATVAHRALSDGDCKRLVDAMVTTSTPEPVGVTGVRDDDEIGSMRATAWSPELASSLWARVRPAVPAVRFLDERSATDGYAEGGRTGHRTWRAVGLGPVLRFMRYSAGGRHLCHYDAAYDYRDGRRTLASVVFFLTEPGNGGALRFVDDRQQDRPTWMRDHSDWDRDTQPDEVELCVVPERGSAVVFDHRRGHDVERWDGPGERIIIRADIVYEVIPDGRGLP